MEHHTFKIPLHELESSNPLQTPIPRDAISLGKELRSLEELWATLSAPFSQCRLTVAINANILQVELFGPFSEALLIGIASSALDDQVTPIAGIVMLRLISTEYPDDPELSFMIGQLLHRAGSRERAVEWFSLSELQDGDEFQTECLITSQDSAGDRATQRPLYLGELAFRLQRQSEAVAWFLHSTHTGGGIVALNGLGVCAFTMGHPLIAVQHLKTAVARHGEEVIDEMDMRSAVLIAMNLARAAAVAGDQINAALGYSRAARWAGGVERARGLGDDIAAFLENGWFSIQPKSHLKAQYHEETQHLVLEV